jgi:hypothetical protein
MSNDKKPATGKKLTGKKISGVKSLKKFNPVDG